MPINFDHTANVINTNDGNVSFSMTGALKVPSGTTAQRPTGVAGHLRFNITTSDFEGFDGANWLELNYTSTDFDTDFSNKTTTDLTEGTNLYYTTTRVNADIDTRVSKAYVDALNVDADTLDTLNSLQFLRSDTSDTMSGSLTVTGQINEANRLYYDIVSGTGTEYFLLGQIRTSGSSDNGYAEIEISNAVDFGQTNSNSILKVLMKQRSGTIDAFATFLGDRVSSKNANILITTPDANTTMNVYLKVDAFARCTVSIKHLFDFSWETSPNSAGSSITDSVSWDSASNIVHTISNAGDVTATSFIGPLTGNASTASAWATGRTITLTGDVTGTSAAWDGSGNISIATTAVHAGVATSTTPPGSPLDGDLWFDTDNGSLYVYFNDGNTSQWVEAAGQTGAGSGSGGGSPFTDTGTYVYYGGSLNVGIGTATPAYALDVVGNINASEDVIAYSDKRLKENIFTYNDAMVTVKKLRGVRFNKINNFKTSVGLIAQEVEAALPEAVHVNPDTGYLSVAYGNIVGVLVEAIKEQDTEIQDLKTMIQALTTRLDKLDGSI